MLLNDAYNFHVAYARDGAVNFYMEFDVKEL